MNNPRLAARYAKSLIGLSVEQKNLDAVYADMKFLRSVCTTNKDFVAVLKSPVIQSDKKQQVIESITASRVTKLTTLFIQLLIRKTREMNLPEIADAFITQYNTINSIYKVKITTAVPMESSLHNAIIDKVKSNSSMQNIELETAVEDELIGGFKLEMGDLLVDATILKDLNEVKRQFLSNEYVRKIR